MARASHWILFSFAGLWLVGCDPAPGNKTPSLATSDAKADDGDESWLGNFIIDLVREGREENRTAIEIDEATDEAQPTLTQLVAERDYQVTDVYQVFYR